MPTITASLDQLPFLIKLIDDSSPTVRAKVAQQLRVLGPEVWEHIRERGLILTPAQERELRDLTRSGKDGGFQAAWDKWLRAAANPGKDENWKLETVLALLARWQTEQQSSTANAGVQPRRLSFLLDTLASEFLQSGRPCQAGELSEFLFSNRLSGAGPDEYYHPQSSNLAHVLEVGHGLPISLTAIFILVGKRVGLDIYGCAFPGHFLARAVEGDHDLVFDPFHAGRLLSRGETEAIRRTSPIEMMTPTPAVVIVLRVLHNMANAYYQHDEPEHARFVLGLIEELQSTLQK